MKHCRVCRKELQVGDWDAHIAGRKHKLCEQKEEDSEWGLSVGGSVASTPRAPVQNASDGDVTTIEVPLLKPLQLGVGFSKKSLEVTHVTSGSLFNRLGITPLMTVLSVNGVPTATKKHFYNQLNASGPTATLTIATNNYTSCKGTITNTNSTNSTAYWVKPDYPLFRNGSVDCGDVIASFSASGKRPRAGHRVSIKWDGSRYAGELLPDHHQIVAEETSAKNEPALHIMIEKEVDGLTCCVPYRFSRVGCRKGQLKYALANAVHAACPKIVTEVSVQRGMLVVGGEELKLSGSERVVSAALRSLKRLCGVAMIPNNIADGDQQELANQEVKKELADLIVQKPGRKLSGYGVFRRVSAATEQMVNHKFAGDMGSETMGVWEVANPYLEAEYRRTVAAFVGKHGSLPDEVEAYHGTDPSNLVSIATSGFLKSKRRVQAYGPGEYFARSPSTSVSYCRGGSYMFLCKLVIGEASVDHTYVGGPGYYIVKQDSYTQAFPMYLIKFKECTTPEIAMKLERPRSFVASGSADEVLESGLGNPSERPLTCRATLSPAARFFVRMATPASAGTGFAAARQHFLGLLETALDVPPSAVSVHEPHPTFTLAVSLQAPLSGLQLSSLIQASGTTRLYIHSDSPEGSELDCPLDEFCAFKTPPPNVLWYERCPYRHAMDAEKCGGVEVQFPEQVGKTDALLPRVSKRRVTMRRVLNPTQVELYERMKASLGTRLAGEREFWYRAPRDCTDASRGYIAPDCHPTSRTWQEITLTASPPATNSGQEVTLIRCKVNLGTLTTPDTISGNSRLSHDAAAVTVNHPAQVLPLFVITISP